MVPKLPRTCANKYTPANTAKDPENSFISVGTRAELIPNRISVRMTTCFNAIRRTKTFTPPTKPLRSLAIAAAADNARNPAAEPIKPRPLGHAFLNNAGFEKWSDGRPVGWTLDRGEVRPELTMTMNGRRSLALMVDRKETHPWPFSRISSAPFVLKPNTEYRLSVWASMPDTVGDMRFEVAGADDGEVASYRSGWCKSHPWLQLT